ncbi:hypothetical protein V6N13_130545 [Hibiscus sabdariffa]|uniref:Uncharacterized protein n=2 Tax=Hibiscus sabdariffa TaxID=183260 RepID=A0ABR2B6A8_9ROSI
MLPFQPFLCAVIWDVIHLILGRAFGVLGPCLKKILTGELVMDVGSTSGMMLGGAGQGDGRVFTAHINPQADLIDSNSNTWKEDVICLIFSPTQAEHIPKYLKLTP